MADNEAIIEKRLRTVYQAAYNDLKKQLDAFQKQYRLKDAQKRKELEDGKITAEEYASWQRSQIFVGKQWKAKVDHAADTLLHANREAMKIVDGERMNTFSDNVVHMTKQIDKDARAAWGFGIYSPEAIERLIKEEPELLPRKEVNGKKDKAWNRKNIANAVAQGIIQGDDIPTIARRIAEKTASTNMKAMVRYARTAMTGAENAGRIESMHYAQSMGVKVRKRWLATLDRRTRHSHQLLDGQVQDVDKPFQSIYGDIRFPGDPEAHPGDVYNCRCTLTYVFPDFDDIKTGIEHHDQRGMNPNGQISSGSLEKAAEIMNIEKIEFRKLDKKLSQSEIINRIGGDDATEGSCSSLAFAYIANKGGYDVLDFRGGDSREYFAYDTVIEKIADFKGVNSMKTKMLNDFDAASALQDFMVAGKEYYFTVGNHAAIVKKTANGNYRYLELQSGELNGFKPLTKKALKWRFGCETEHKDEDGKPYKGLGVVIDIDSLKKNDDFLSAMKYINTKRVEGSVQ